MYDVIVVGGGHAGIEASLAPSRMGLKTLLVTSNINNIGSMPCNTSIGGPAKGIIVREIDALGGQMSKTADKTYLQMKMLNTAKGPGVQSLRAQADKKAYPRYMQKVVKEQENLDLIEGMVEDLVVEDQTVKGVILDDGTTYLAKTVILTTGTYLKAEILVGHSKHASGPDQQKESKFLSGKLKDYGFRIQRLKTGTPPRVEINSIDYSKTSLQPGTDAKLAFSFTTDEYVPIEKQTPCYLTYTNETTHKIIHDNLEKCAMYSGLVKDKEYQRYQTKMKGIYDEIERLSTIRFTPKDDINEMLEQNNSSHLKEGVSAKELITRPEITYDMMLPYIDAPELSEEQRRRITILIKYAGYIEKAKRQAQKQIKMEEKHIPEDIDYEDVKNLALEAKQKLSEIRPLTIGQASRISGINPADISVLLIYLKQKYNGE